MLWTEDQELELCRLFEEFRDSDGESAWLAGSNFIYSQHSRALVSWRNEISRVEMKELGPETFLRLPTHLFLVVEFSTVEGLFSSEPPKAKGLLISICQSLSPHHQVLNWLL